MDYSRPPGASCSYNSDDEHEEQRNQTQTYKMKDDYMELDSHYQSTVSTDISTDVNFLEIAARFLGRSGMAVFQQLKGERRLEEIDPYIQYRIGMPQADVSSDQDENVHVHASSSNYESCEINSENGEIHPTPGSSVQSSGIDAVKEEYLYRERLENVLVTEGTSKGNLYQTNNMKDEQVENDIVNRDGYSHNSQKNECREEVRTDNEPVNENESKAQLDKSESHSIENRPISIDNENDEENMTRDPEAEGAVIDQQETEGLSKDQHETEGLSKDQETTLEKEMKKTLDSISVRYDTATQTYICMKVAKNKDKNQLVCKVNANQTDSSIAARELPYKCKFCDEAFSLFSQLKRHTKIHSDDSPFACQTCGRIYQNETELLKHGKKHNRPKPHTCSICQKSFRQQHMLENHVRTHNGEKPFLCQTCGQGFGQKENLKLHERWHSDVKPHKCAVCGKQFNNTKCLHRHELTHSNERNYSCDICGKSYLRNDHLRRHKRSHGEEPRFKCSYCGKGFHQKVNVEEHERIHTGDRPFVCEVCGKGFTQRGNLKSHLIKHSFV